MKVIESLSTGYGGVIRKDKNHEINCRFDLFITSYCGESNYLGKV